MGNSAYRGLKSEGSKVCKSASYSAKFSKARSLSVSSDGSYISVKSTHSAPVLPTSYFQTETVATRSQTKKILAHNNIAIDIAKSENRITRSMFHSVLSSSYSSSGLILPKENISIDKFNMKPMVKSIHFVQKRGLSSLASNSGGVTPEDSDSETISVKEPVTSNESRVETGEKKSLISPDEIDRLLDSIFTVMFKNNESLAKKIGEQINQKLDKNSYDQIEILKTFMSMMHEAQRQHNELYEVILKEVLNINKELRLIKEQSNKYKEPGKTWGHSETLALLQIIISIIVIVINELKEKNREKKENEIERKCALLKEENSLLKREIEEQKEITKLVNEKLKQVLNEKEITGSGIFDTMKRILSWK